MLKQEITKRGLTSRVDYFNMRFAQLVGLPLYTHLSGTSLLSPLAGEWLFACVAFEDSLRNRDLIVDQILSDWSLRTSHFRDLANRQVEEDLILKVLSLIPTCREFIDTCVEEIISERPAVVGFTTISHQTPACLAVARRLKSFASGFAIFFGGPNCHGERGLQMIRSFPWIDYVCTAAGDHVFPAFVQRILDQEDPPSGILSRSAAVDLTLPETVMEIDSVSIPDYSDYFRQRAQSRIHSEMDPPALLTEMSRGCW